MLHIHKDGERGRGNQEGGGREGEEGTIIFQAHSDSRQDLHFDIHKLTAPAKDSYKNYLREQKIKLTL